MTRLGRRRGDDRGATAVLAAVLAVILIGISAFTVDFGRAYASKRQLQNAADAGSLAGASYYADKEGTCAALDGNLAYESASRAVAQAILLESRPNATIDSYEVGCLDGELIVDLSVIGSTPVAFGGVYGADSITTQRQAQATLEVPPTIGRGLRPYMLCSADIPSPVPSGVVKVEFPGQAGMSEDCPTANNPGNWWTINCPEDGSNSTAVLAENTVNGCASPVSIVPGQPDVEPDPADNQDLRDVLLAGCSSGPDEDCLNAVTGDINSAPIWDAWRTLLGKKILIPIFCGDLTCDPAAVVPAPGNNTNYPVHRFGAVVVCGFHWGAGAQKQGISTSGECLGNTHDVTVGDNQDNYVLLKFTQVQTSGSTTDGDCALDDDECDGGARQVRLTQ